MVTRSKENKTNEPMKRRAKVGKLQLKKERIKELTPDQQKQIKGGQFNRMPTDTRGWTCSCTLANDLTRRRRSTVEVLDMIG